jgi:DNA-binding CsgD family transcriptional regulator
MPYVTEQSLQTLTTALQELYTPVSLETFPSYVLSALARVLSADLSAYNEVDRTKRRIEVIFNSPDVQFREQAACVQFTKRESDILYWLMRDKSNREIALRLGLSPNTGRARLEDVFSKLDVSTRTAAALRARKALRTNFRSLHTSSLAWPDGES